MGYTTDFAGELTLSRKLTETEKSYINTFSGTRRMRRDVNKLMEIYKGKYGYPFPKDQTPESIYGNEGEYFAHDDGNSGQKEDASILNYNDPPGQISCGRDDNFMNKLMDNRERIKKGLCQPGLWCQWVIESNNDGDVLMWDGGEKFYDYVPWLKYLINHFFEKWGVKLNGTIEWTGEDPKDMGKIIVNDNEVRTQRAEISFIDDDED